VTDSEVRVELERCHPAAWEWALHCCDHDHDTAADTLQQAYLQVLDGRARFGGRSAFRTWLFGVIRRTACSERRKAWWRGVLLSRHAGDAPTPSPTDSASAVELDDEARRLEAALGRLSKRQRAVLELVFYHDCSVAEAAEVMGIPVGTARTHYARGKQRLAGLLAGER
jgi:RNA polymerase sigma-70 factor (ECF subfamily)